MALIDDARSRNLINSIPTGGYPKAPAADGSQNNPLNSDAGRAITNTLSALPGAGSVPGAAVRGGSLVARAFGASQPALSAAGQAAQAAAPYAPIVAGGAALANATSADSPAPVASPPAPRPLMQAAFGEAYGPVGSVANASPASPPAPSNVTRDGNSYSGSDVAGDITINGQRAADARVALVGQQISSTYQGALNAAITKQASLQAAADRAGRERDGLRKQLSNAEQRLADASPSALIEYASTLNRLFGQCSQRYTELAARADGHAADAATCRAAWPMMPTTTKETS